MFVNSAAIFAVLALSIAATQVAKGDSEFEKTPSELEILLGENGVPRTTGFALAVKVKGMEPGEIHWKMSKGRESIRFEAFSSRPTRASAYAATRGLFTFNGDDETYEFSLSGDFKSLQEVGKDRRDKVKRTYSIKRLNPTTVAVDAGRGRKATFPFEKMENTIVPAWLPLAFAYHLQKGHERFEVLVSEVAQGTEGRLLRYETTGLETITIGEKEVKTIKVLEKTFYPTGDKLEESTTKTWLWLLPDGAVAKAEWLKGGQSLGHGTALNVIPDGNQQGPPKSDTQTSPIDYVEKIEALLAKIPKKNQPTEEQWAVTEDALGTKLPDDYKKALSMIGMGSFFDEITFFAPNENRAVDLAKRSDENNKHWPDIKTFQNEPKRNYARKLFPEKGGLLQFGSSASAFGYCWNTKNPDPNQWSIVWVDLENGWLIRREIEMSFSEFLYKAIGEDSTFENEELSELFRDLKSKRKEIFKPF